MFFIPTFFSFVASWILAYIPIHTIIGSYAGSITALSWSAPLLAGPGGFGALVYFFLRLRLHFYSIHRLPTLVSCLGYFSVSRLAKLGVIVGLWAAFVVHPIGMQVWWYSLYWSIPCIALYALKKESPFQNAIVTTFIAHAVGSVLWLYVYNLPIQYWCAAVWVVPFERMIHVSGLLAVAMIQRLCISIIQRCFQVIRY